MDVAATYPIASARADLQRLQPVQRPALGDVRRCAPEAAGASQPAIQLVAPAGPSDAGARASYDRDRMATPGENATALTNCSIRPATRSRATSGSAPGNSQRAFSSRARHHPEAELILRTATAYLETEARAGRSVLGQPGSPLHVRDVLRRRPARRGSRVSSAMPTWRNTLERFRRRCARAVRRYDGYIHEAAGDELLILFGYPRVREDDARRAVLAGLDVVASIESFSGSSRREHGISFRVRVGIHTGPGADQGARPWQAPPATRAEIGGGLVGEAAHIAKRVEAAAAPNTVWVSGATRRIVEGFFEFATATRRREARRSIRQPPRALRRIRSMRAPPRSIGTRSPESGRTRWSGGWLNASGCSSCGSRPGPRGRRSSS